MQISLGKRNLTHTFINLIIFILFVISCDTGPPHPMRQFKWISIGCKKPGKFDSNLFSELTIWRQIHCNRSIGGGRLEGNPAKEAFDILPFWRTRFQLAPVLCLTRRRGPRTGNLLLTNPVVGEGKPENQNHAMIFTRGEFLQTIDMNQEGYFEEALKMRNCLQEFAKREGPLPTTILGLREHIFTGSVRWCCLFR